MDRPPEPEAVQREERVPHGGGLPPAEPEGPHELWLQERDPFEDFTLHIDEQDERRAPTAAERQEMDARLEALGDLFAGATARWHLDGALNISLLVGDYIGVHKDVDISIDADDLAGVEPLLRERGYGFFLSKFKDPKDEKSPRILQRVGAEALRRATDHATLAAIDAEGRVREDVPLNFIDVHLMYREPDGRVRGIGNLGSPIPAAWCEGIPTEFHGRTLQRSHPAKVAYFKLHQTRSYDRTDLEKLARSGALTADDLDTIEGVFREDVARRRAKAEEIFHGVATRLRPDATAAEILEAFRADPFLTADAARWERALPKLQRVAERVAEGGDPTRVAVIAAEELGIERTHAEQLQKVAEFREWAVSGTEEDRGGATEREDVAVGNLGAFDAEYFQSLEGPGGWIALGQENCRNQRYFTVYGAGGDKLGIVGVYDTDDDQHISHTVVDPKFRGRGLAAQFKERLMGELDLPFLTLTISTSNEASLRAAAKLPGAVRVSDEAYEREFQKVKYRFERGAETALSIEERQQLAEVWSWVVLSGRVEAPDSDRQTSGEFRTWLYESLMREVGELADEWGMVPDETLIERIRAAGTSEERAGAETEYLRWCRELFVKRTSTFRPSSERSTMWDSWPDTMRGSGAFNCAGAVLLGQHLLQRAGISSELGNPVGHVVNVAQLSDGSWWYADFVSDDVRQIQPIQEEIAGVPAFAFREDGLEYRHMLLRPATDAVSVVLDNLSSLQHVAREGGSASDDAEVRTAREYMDRYRGTLDVVDLEPLATKLGGRIHGAMESPVMRAETARVHALHDIASDPRMQAFREEIGDRDAQAAFLRTVVPHVDQIHRFLAGADTIGDASDDRIRRFAELADEVIVSKAMRGTELHRELVSDFIARLRRIPTGS